MDHSEQAKLLITRYLEGKATEEEKMLVERFYLEQFKKQSLPEDFADTSDIKLEIWKAVEEQMQSRPAKPVIRLWPRTAAAASILLCLAAGLYFYGRKTANTQLAKNDIAPGSNKAVLIAHGKKYVLDSTRSGVITQQGNVFINKKADGRLVYQESPSEIQHATFETHYDTLTVPRGGQHQLVLADGSKVWLNAATSIRYPENFSGKERKIELIYGEAYIEAVHNAKMPFRVAVGNQVIEDIGTQFNINAYPDESFTRTTLIEGSILVSSGNTRNVIKPGQQAIAGRDELRIADADTEATIAWKNGDFIFKNEDFKTVMRKIARWYDVEVLYDNSAPVSHIPGGMVSRSKNISAVLKIMESTGKVHFKVEGRRITVTR